MTSVQAFSTALKQAYGINIDEAGLTIEEAKKWAETYDTGREAAFEFGKKYDLTPAVNYGFREAKRIIRRFE